jgi:hypothetical protein
VRWIDENRDLFPQRYARIMRGIERGESFPRSTIVGRGRERGKMS